MNIRKKKIKLPRAGDTFHPKAVPPIVFVNSPIEDETSDIVGLTSKADSIKEAIRHGAQIIGIVGQYGSGKTSLTNLIAKKRGTFKRVITVNLWDTLSAFPDGTEPSVTDLTKSFLFQIAAGLSDSTARYVNRRLNKNFDILSFCVESGWLWVWAALSALFFIAYEGLSAIQPASYARTLAVLLGMEPEILGWGISLIQPWSPVLLGLSILFMLFGLRKASLAYARGREHARDPELGDVFAAYFHLHRKLCRWGRKPCMILVEDLDRISDPKLVLAFMKEIYRFCDIVPTRHRKGPIFLISVMPEADLVEKDRATENIYSKLFDYIVELQPINYQDYGDLLMRILEASPKSRARLAELLGGEMPSSFHWLTVGTNLTVRELKQRLNDAVSLFVDLKNKQYQNAQGIRFSACTAVTYLKHQYPEQFRHLLTQEKDLDRIIQTLLNSENQYTYSVTSADITDELIQFLETIGKPDEGPQMLQDLQQMLVYGDISVDYRMYFYSYPKYSYILSPDEQIVKDAILDSVDRDLIYVYKQFHLNMSLRRALDRLISQNLNSVEKVKIIEDCLTKFPDGLGRYPLIVGYIEPFLSGSYSVDEEALGRALFKAVPEDMSLMPDYWKCIRKLIFNDARDDCRLDRMRYAFCTELAWQLLMMDQKEIVAKRLEIITGLQDDIAYFLFLFEPFHSPYYEQVIDMYSVYIPDYEPDLDEYNGNPIYPMITLEELQAIPTRDLALELIDVPRITEKHCDYILKFLNEGTFAPDSAENLARILSKIIEMGDPGVIRNQMIVFWGKNNAIAKKILGFVLQRLSGNDSREVDAIVLCLRSISRKTAQMILRSYKNRLIELFGQQVYNSFCE